MCQCIVHHSSYYRSTWSQIQNLYSGIQNTRECGFSFGQKNVFKLEGVINTRDYRFEFLNRSVPIYPEKELILKPNEQKLVKVRAPFVDGISGLAIIKIIDGRTNSTLLIKLKFMCNKGSFGHEECRQGHNDLYPKEMIGIVDIRSLG